MDSASGERSGIKPPAPRVFAAQDSAVNLNMHKLRAGDWVEVRSKEEILRTLDGKGQLEGMPFMPEMFAFCGRRFQVHKRAHKTCDTVFPVRGRRVDDAVHLDTRCDGSAHGGCQARCMIFWKLAWLKPVGLEGESNLTGNSNAPSSGCSEANVREHTQIADPLSVEPIYSCQATLLPYFTKDLNWWEWDQYVEDYTSGNTSLGRVLCGAVYALYHGLARSGIGLGRPMRWFYDKFHFLWKGTPWPRKTGVIPQGQPTPAEALDLQPGELVRIKSHDEILKTLTTTNMNRGLYWDAEEVPFCGGTYPVLARVHKIINERTGTMQEMKTPCVILESVVCEGRYSECRYFCPRSIYPYWREIWLVRAAGPTDSGKTKS